ncbi:MAG: tRNA (adenosine(37)-N6)-threonylcarbamoyltransferase complex ATPase subunit type 1 TsaE [Chloroflexota bacterium]
MSRPGHDAARTTATEAEVRLRTRSEAETRDLAATLALVAQPGDRVALRGPLGAGKTRFAQGFARGLGVREPVTSPTFTLEHAYAGRIALRHQDLYRCSDAADAEAAGLLDVDAGATSVTLVEWADRLGAAPDPGAIEIALLPATGGGRLVHLAATDARYRAWLDRAAAWADAHGARA